MQLFLEHRQLQFSRSMVYEVENKGRIKWFKEPMNVFEVYALKLYKTIYIVMAWAWTTLITFPFNSISSAPPQQSIYFKLDKTNKKKSKKVCIILVLKLPFDVTNIFQVGMICFFKIPSDCNILRSHMGHCLIVKLLWKKINNELNIECLIKHPR
jgi:hypothetical protein